MRGKREPSVLISFKCCRIVATTGWRIVCARERERARARMGVHVRVTACNRPFAATALLLRCRRIRKESYGRPLKRLPPSRVCANVCVCAHTQFAWRAWCVRACRHACMLSDPEVMVSRKHEAEGMPAIITSAQRLTIQQISSTSHKPALA